MFLTSPYIDQAITLIKDWPKRSIMIALENNHLSEDSQDDSSHFFRTRK
jgi:hypothetical protein